MTNIDRIDLGEARTSADSKVFSGRERGLAARLKFALDRFDKEGREVIVAIPRDTYSMNLSFFLGMFGDSVRALGADVFRKRYHFDADPVLLQSIGEGIVRALKESSVLPEKKTKKAA